jgi:hypothetical protein
MIQYPNAQVESVDLMKEKDSDSAERIKRAWAAAHPWSASSLIEELFDRRQWFQVVYIAKKEKRKVQCRTSWYTTTFGFSLGRGHNPTSASGKAG